MSLLVLASSNTGKIVEFQALAEKISVELVPQSQFQVSSVAETGLTFVENALLKARHASQQTCLPALADDSGLEVDALQGEPGIYSARYAGEPTNATKNITKLLTALAGIKQRNARFRCILVLMQHARDPAPLIAQGVLEGSILLEPRGQNGFGYDAIFTPHGSDQSLAELSAAEKNRLSHRAKALENLIYLMS